MKHIIAGNGEVGGALFSVIGGVIHDPLKNFIVHGKCDVLHVCFPYSRLFIKTVKEYQKRFESGLTIIHSTVPIGTSRKCNAVHSPIRGVHPYLESGIRLFVKFFGGTRASEAAAIFSELNIKTHITSKPETTEALKLWDTTQYGYMILLNRKIKKWCDKNNVDFDIIYTEANKTYNDGYSKLGRPEVMRPFLHHMPGLIGGHCVRQNAHLLDKKIAVKFEESR
jgi:UDP-N-acetyl-D-mannosaminuronate dehydrogenase